MLGTSLLRSLLALVLFDLGVSQSFVSSGFSRSFGIPLDALEHPMWIYVAFQERVPVTSVFLNFTLKIFGVIYPIDLVPIPMRDVSVIIGMDWLIWFRAQIDCER